MTQGEAMTDEAIDAALLLLIAEYVGRITGLKPPTDRALYPAEMLPALTEFRNGIKAIFLSSIENSVEIIGNLQKHAADQSAQLSALQARERTLREALTELAIVEHLRLTVGGFGFMLSGYSCKLCGAKTDGEHQPPHAPACALYVTPPPPAQGETK